MVHLIPANDHKKNSDGFRDFFVKKKKKKPTDLIFDHTRDSSFTRGGPIPVGVALVGGVGAVLVVGPPSDTGGPSPKTTQSFLAP